MTARTSDAYLLILEEIERRLLKLPGILQAQAPGGVNADWWIIAEFDGIPTPATLEALKRRIKTEIIKPLRTPSYLQTAKRNRGY